MKKLSTPLLIFMIVSCKDRNDVPSGIIRPAQMQAVFWDMIRGDLLAQEIIKKDSTQNIKSAGFAITQKIFTIYNIDSNKFKKSLNFYESHPVLLKTIFDSLNAMQTRSSVLKYEKKGNLLKDYHLSHSNKIP